MWIADWPASPGRVSQGKTEPEALENIREATLGCLEVRAEQGPPLTVRVTQVEVALG
jgi:predicted RNase H-like HicB family nuclease